MANSFVERIIEVTFRLQSGAFQGTGSANTVALPPLRTSAHIIKSGGQSQGELQLSVYGMTLDLMSQLSLLGQTPIRIGKNFVTVAAGDAESGVYTVFEGAIAQAYIDLENAPDGMFNVTAFAGLYEALQTIPPSSYTGSTDVATIMSSLASQMGLTFENNGVSVKLDSPYFPGSAKSQMDAAAKAANIYAYIDNGKLAIWPKDGNRSAVVPLISPDTGMIGYPFPSGQGLLGVRTVFNPNVTFGGKIQVNSQIKQAVGAWGIVRIEHDIESQFPGGNWETEIIGTPPGYLGVARVTT